MAILKLQQSHMKTGEYQYRLHSTNQGKRISRQPAMEITTLTFKVTFKERLKNQVNTQSRKQNIQNPK